MKIKMQNTEFEENQEQNRDERNAETQQ